MINGRNLVHNVHNVHMAFFTEITLLIELYARIKDGWKLAAVNEKFVILTHESEGVYSLTLGADENPDEFKPLLVFCERFLQAREYGSDLYKQTSCAPGFNIRYLSDAASRSREYALRSAILDALHFGRTRRTDVVTCIGELADFRAILSMIEQGSRPKQIIKHFRSV